MPYSDGDRGLVGRARIAPSQRAFCCCYCCCSPYNAPAFFDQRRAWLTIADRRSSYGTKPLKENCTVSTLCSGCRCFAGVDEYRSEARLGLRVWDAAEYILSTENIHVHFLMEQNSPFSYGSLFLPFSKPTRACRGSKRAVGGERRRGPFSQPGDAPLPRAAANPSTLADQSFATAPAALVWVFLTHIVIIFAFSICSSSTAATEHSTAQTELIVVVDRRCTYILWCSPAIGHCTGGR